MCGQQEQWSLSFSLFSRYSQERMILIRFIEYFKSWAARQKKHGRLEIPRHHIISHDVTEWDVTWHDTTLHIKNIHIIWFFLSLEIAICSVLLLSSSDRFFLPSCLGCERPTWLQQSELSYIAASWFKDFDTACSVKRHSILPFHAVLGSSQKGDCWTGKEQLLLHTISPCMLYFWTPNTIKNRIEHFKASYEKRGEHWRIFDKPFGVIQKWFFENMSHYL